jgi:hypothetical protein
MALNPNEVLKNAQQAKGGPNEQKEGPADEKKGFFSRFSKMKCLVAGLALTTAIAGAHGCASDKTDEIPPVPDAAVDAGPDSDSQTDADTSTDTGTETDTGTDTGTETDTGTDTGTDSGLDGGMDSGPDTDSGVDAGPVACAEATTGTFDSTIFAGATETVGGYVFGYTGTDGSGNAVFSIACGGSVVEASYAFPVGEKTTLNIELDGKKIEVTPHIATSTVVSVGIAVKNL